MIKLYYTVPEKEDVEQIRPMLSLGGYRASNTIPNADFGNLFGEITSLTIDKNKDEYRAMVIRNESTETLINVRLWFIYPEKAYAKFMIAAVQMVPGEGGSLIMEHINTIYSKPMYAEFFEAAGEDNAVTIGDMEVGTQVGIWLKRSLNIAQIEEVKNSFVVKNIQTKQYEMVPLETSEIVDLTIDWED